MYGLVGIKEILKGGGGGRKSYGHFAFGKRERGKKGNFVYLVHF